MMGIFKDGLKEVEAIHGVLDDILDRVDLVRGDIGSVETSVDQVASCCAETNSQLTQMDNALDAGFSNLSQGLNVLITQQAYTNRVLDHQSRQNETIICVLENISRAVCGVHNETHTQSELQRSIEASTGTLMELFKSTHPEATLELERLKKLEEQMLECCPPEEPQPVCLYEPCDTPESMDEEPPPSEFDPLPPPPPPVG